MNSVLRTLFSTIEVVIYERRGTKEDDQKVVGGGRRPMIAVILSIPRYIHSMRGV